MKSEKVLIIGAGLTGAMMSLILARHGYEVEVYEKRPDIRLDGTDRGRSINLALSARGIQALRLLGIDGQVLGNAVPMYARALHGLDDTLKTIPYGKDDTEYINSISRGGLIEDLINYTEPHPNVTYFFGHKCVDIDFENSILSFETIEGASKTIKADAIISADGAGSFVRRQMMTLDGYVQNIDFLEHGYKELEIKAGLDGSFQLPKNALHIWPRGSFMLIALPNIDATFTLTLFLANEGKESFETLQDREQIDAFFEQYFPDAKALMPELATNFVDNPVGILGTVKCYPWCAHQTLLIGDAAHAIVPFYGQGMNAAFEDCVILDQYLSQYKGDFGRAFEEYQKARKADTDAIADLAIENYKEMRDTVTDLNFQKMRALERRLENTFADYHSKYSMVTFHPEIGYAHAMTLGNLQNKILYDICAQSQDIEELDLQEVFQSLKEKTNHLQPN